jgi:hypothetical protein
MTSLPMPGGLAAVLGCILAWQLTPVSEATPDIAAPRPEPARTAVAASPEPYSLTEFGRAVLERPLFSPTRRLAPPHEVLPSGHAADMPRLAGVIIGPAGGRAIFDDGSGRPRVARQGDRIGRFKVGSITPGQVSLLSSEGERVLRPKYINQPEPPDHAQ